MSLKMPSLVFFTNEMKIHMLLLFLRLTENSYFEIKFFEIDLVAKKFFFDFEFSVSLFSPTSHRDHHQT